MQYQRLGTTALRVSRICLGTMNFGPRTAEVESHAILDAAVEVGVNFIDTANQYGGTLGVGASETIIGNWLVQSPSRRDRLVLATKVHEPMSDDINDRGLSARHIIAACEASLKRLRVDHVDLYQMHHVDRSARPEEIWQAMDRLTAAGKILYVGSSNFPGWMIAQTSERARVANRLGLVSEQSLYNLVERRAELEVIPACQAYGIGVIAWSPLAGGLLAGSLSADTVRRRASRAAMSPAREAQIYRFEALCAGIRLAPGEVALAWTLAQPGVTAGIAGPATKIQLASAVQAVGIKLDEDILAELDTIFPPCGPAPEAYAW